MQELFRLFIEHLDCEKVRTELVFKDESSFIEAVARLYRSVDSSSVSQVTQYCILVTKEGIVYFVHFRVHEIGEEGPNNEPPSGWTQPIIEWCTKSSKLKRAVKELGIPNSPESLRKMKALAQIDLGEHVAYT